jgi:t-SNARE complex subunit (syntaxin)
MSNAEYQQQTQANMERIDAQLDQLVDMTGSHKVKATAIGNTLEDQNRRLKDVEGQMDNTQVEIDKAIEQAREVQVATSNWIGWILCILLIIGIILVWVL